MKIDFLTTIIDNYGDAGFAFNLALALSSQKPDVKIRFFCDNKELFLKLKWNLITQNIEYFDLKEFDKLTPSTTLFNFFDRKINFEFLHSFTFPIKLINFTYFLMHIWVRSLHNTHYVSKNVSVTHYIPSILDEGWWVIIHPEIEKYHQFFKNSDIVSERKKEFPWYPEEFYYKKWISLFCYSDTFKDIASSIENDLNNIYFIFDHEKTAENIVNMPFLDILSYQKFLFLCDKNIVRGENSLVAAILAGRPFLWDIYKEHNGAHKEKIDDFQTFLSTYNQRETQIYNKLFFDFNMSENKAQAFTEFVLSTRGKLFEKISQKVYLKNNFLKNLEKLL